MLASVVKKCFNRIKGKNARFETDLSSRRPIESTLRRLLTFLALLTAIMNREETTNHQSIGTPGIPSDRSDQTQSSFSKSTLFTICCKVYKFDVGIPALDCWNFSLKQKCRKVFFKLIICKGPRIQHWAWKIVEMENFTLLRHCYCIVELEYEFWNNLIFEPKKHYVIRRNSWKSIRNDTSYTIRSASAV